MFAQVGRCFSVHQTFVYCGLSLSYSHVAGAKLEQALMGRAGRLVLLHEALLWWLALVDRRGSD
jgi:hypothetical protein